MVTHYVPYPSLVLFRESVKGYLLKLYYFLSSMYLPFSSSFYLKVIRRLT